MKVTLEELAQPHLIRIIEEDKDKILEKTNKIWNSRKDSIMMDGFRKGKVPQDLVEKKEGFQNLYAPYISELLTEAVNQVNDNYDVVVADMPQEQIYPEQLGKEGIVIQAVAYLKPKVLELDYSNITVTKLDSTATEQEVTAQLSQLQEQHAIMSPVTDRGVEFGDIVVISYTGYQTDDSGNEIPFKGGSASKQKLLLQENSFIPGFGEEIVSMSPDQSKSFNVTFPEEYQAKNLAGKTCKFDLTLHEIQKKHLPELDDEFAKTCGKDTLEQLKTETTQAITTRKKDYNQTKTETEICLELVKRASISPLPQSMIQKRLGSILQQESGNVGMSAEEYLQRSKTDQATFNRKYYHIAVRDLKVQLLLDYVAESEKVEITEQDRTEYLTSEADRTGYTMEQLNTMVTQTQVDSQVRLRKAYDILLEQANYQEPVSETTNDGN